MRAIIGWMRVHQLIWNIDITSSSGHMDTVTLFDKKWWTDHHDRPSYPLCYTLDLNKHFVFNSSFAPQQIFMVISKAEHLGLTVFIEEKNKKIKRTLKSFQDFYSGPTIKIDDLNKTKYIDIAVKLSQTIYSDEDKRNPCANYPTEDYENFGECDRRYINNKIYNATGIQPFWTADSLDNVTKLMFHK